MKDPYGIKEQKSYFGLFVFIVILVVLVAGISLIKLTYTEKAKEEDQFKIAMSKFELSDENLKKRVVIPAKTRLISKSTKEIEKRDELYNIIYEFGRLISDKEYTKAYSMIDQDTLETFYVEYTEEEFINYIKDIYPERVSLKLINYMDTTTNNKSVDYVMCMVSIEAAHYGDEEVEEYRSTIVDYSLVKTGEGISLIPFSLAMIDKVDEKLGVIP